MYPALKSSLTCPKSARPPTVTLLFCSQEIEPKQSYIGGQMREIKGKTEQPLEIHQAESMLGEVLVACTARGIRAVFMGDEREALYTKMREEFPLAALVEGGLDTQRVAIAVVETIEPAAASANADLPLDLLGTDFQHQVWNALRDVPAGTTATYSEIAETIGRPHAVRAVANACAANRIAILIPCHRAIRRDGGMGGYRWGLERKVRLLEMERARVESLEPSGLA